MTAITTAFLISPTDSYFSFLNLQTPNVNYSWRTAPLTSKRCILYIYSTNVLNILNMVYILRFFPSSKCSLFHNSNVFGSCFIQILYTGCAKIKKNNSGAKMLKIPFREDCRRTSLDGYSTSISNYTLTMLMCFCVIISRILETLKNGEDIRHGLLQQEMAGLIVRVIAVG